MLRRRILIVGASLLLAGVCAGVAIALLRGGSRPPGLTAAPSSPVSDPGVPVSRPAPNFSLTDQFGRRVSLRSFRGEVVILAFNDPVCTTVCPLTTAAMVQAKALLGAAGSQVQLLGVVANPTKTQDRWARAYSQAHGMMHAWHFLTGRLPHLRRVWRAYGIEARIVHGQVDHTPAVYVIDPRGRVSRLYMTPMAYSGVDQLGRDLAKSAAALLPGHRRLHAARSYTEPVSPRATVTLPRVGGGTVRLGPGASPHLLLFFDTWDSEVTNLATHLEALGRYQAAAGGRLPSLIAIDEGSVEPTTSALSRFLDLLPRPLPYPVAIDESGRVADGYRVQDSPWLTLISRSGRFLSYQDISTSGWPTPAGLIRRVRAALARAGG